MNNHEVYRLMSHLSYIIGSLCIAASFLLFGIYATCLAVIFMTIGLILGEIADRKLHESRLDNLKYIDSVRRGRSYQSASAFDGDKLEHNTTFPTTYNTGVTPGITNVIMSQSEDASDAEKYSIEKINKNKRR